MKKKYRTGFVVLGIFAAAFLSVVLVVVFIYQSGFRYIKSNAGIKFFGYIDKNDRIANGRIWYESDAASVSLQKYYIIEARGEYAVSRLPDERTFLSSASSDVLETLNTFLSDSDFNNYSLNNFIFNCSGEGISLKSEVFGDVLSAYENEGIKFSGGDIYAVSGIKWILDVFEEGSFCKDVSVVQFDDESKIYKGDVLEFLKKEDITFASFSFSDGSVVNLYPVQNIYRINYDKGPHSGELYIGGIDFDFQKGGRGLYYYTEIGDIYYGDFKNDEKTGKAEIYSANGDIYIGYIEHGKKNGEGYFIWGDDGSSYSGTFADNMKNGFGLYRFADGSVYEGEYANDIKQGKGKFIWFNGDMYEGDYEGDLYKGFGRYTWANGDYYEGDFDHNTLHGIGTYYWASGRTYTGYWDLAKMVLPDDLPDDIDINGDDIYNRGD
ncbi:MAG: hypothetical protein FWG34_07675 [Oscillospiraceae bacterium]|nr:hypothetical protein [Oscillospiraceae bacterium]